MLARTLEYLGKDSSFDNCDCYHFGLRGQESYISEFRLLKYYGNFSLSCLDFTNLTVLFYIMLDYIMLVYVMVYYVLWHVILYYVEQL